MECYKDLSYLYDKLIYDDINYKEISDYIINKYKQYSSNNLLYLDLACGTGNISVHLAKYFKDTFLVDLSEDMLIEASDKMRKEKVKFKILCQDMTELNLNRKFNLITCVLDSTNYILEKNELISYFRGVYNHLDNGGVFIFDINSSYKIKTILGDNIYSYNTEEIFYTWENSLEDDIVDMYLTFFVKEGELYRRFEEHHTERAYDEKELEIILRDSGFEIMEKHDGYSDEPVSEKSERIVYIVRK